jgi:hypothetical protein
MKQTERLILLAGHAGHSRTRNKCPATNTRTSSLHPHRGGEMSGVSWLTDAMPLRLRAAAPGRRAHRTKFRSRLHNFVGFWTDGRRRAFALRKSATIWYADALIDETLQRIELRRRLYCAASRIASPRLRHHSTTIAISFFEARAQ